MQSATMTAAARKHQQLSKPEWLNTENAIDASCAVIFAGFTALEIYCAVAYFAMGGWYILGGVFFTAGTILFGALLWETLVRLFS